MSASPYHRRETKALGGWSEELVGTGRAPACLTPRNLTALSLLDSAEVFARLSLWAGLGHRPGVSMAGVASAFCPEPAVTSNSHEPTVRHPTSSKRERGRWHPGDGSWPFVPPLWDQLCGLGVLGVHGGGAGLSWLP